MEMTQRVANPSNHAYHDYGGRGIDIDPRWLASFEAFFADMGERPPGHSIERKDNNLGYWPNNCIWLLRRLQSQNRRTVVWVEYQGQKLCLAEACRRAGVQDYRIDSRRRRGMDAQVAFDLVRGMS